MATSGRLLVVASAAALMLACGSGNQRNETRAANALDARVCTQEDLGGGFNEETAGNFSPTNLADLGPNSDARSRALVDAGLARGHFAYWKQVPAAPPFEPQTDVVCQTLEFETPEQAAAFLRALQPSEESLVTAGIAWLHDGHREVTEQPAPPDPAGARAFAIRAAGGEQDAAVYALIVARGPYVRSVYVQAPGVTGQLERAAAILAATIRRIP